MNLEQHVDELGATLEAGRRRLATVELGDVLDAAVAEIRAIGPERWRPQHRSRWPVVAGVLILGTVAVTVIYLLPTLQRAVETHHPIKPDGAQTDPAPRPDPIPYSEGPWGSTYEEKNRGEETGF